MILEAEKGLDEDDLAEYTGLELSFPLDGKYAKSS